MSQEKIIPLMVPDINEKDVNAVAEVLRTGMLVQGIHVAQLEQSIADYLGINHAIIVSSGTATLHLALLAMGIGAGDEVIVPAFSFMATANVVELVGARPVFVDIDINTYNVNPRLVEQAITANTKAVIPVHEFGLACEITEICRIASKYKLKVIEDAACALGATENGKYVGTFGDVGSFSFHPRKAITSGEGGVLVTNNQELASKLRSLRNHGIKHDSFTMEFIEAGLNYRMTDFQAALLYSQFERFESILNKKRILAALYIEEMKDIKTMLLPTYPENKNHTWQSFHVLVDGYRDGVIEFLKGKGIGANYGAQCMPMQVYYSKKYGYDCKKLFPNSLKAFLYGLALPMYSSLNGDDIKYIVKTIESMPLIEPQA